MAQPSRALRGPDSLGLRQCDCSVGEGQDGQDDGGQTRFVTELHASTVEVLDGQQD
jgi:hypothetical protein